MSDTTAGTKTYDVAVLGCGLMGAALARNFAAQGLRTAAWNRSPDKAEALAPDGVTPVRDIADAVRDARLVVACTSTYGTTKTSLEGTTDWAGTTLVNIGTGTPGEAEDMQAWATARGARYLDGAILCYPQQVGTGEGMILYSGSPEAWAEHEQVLMTPGPYSALVSDNVKAASVLDAAVVGGFYSAALNAYVEAATYAFSQGIDPETLNAISEMTFQVIAATGKECVAAIASDQHETDTAYLGTYADGCRATLGVMQEAGFKARLLEAAVANLTEAQEAGLGGLGFSALTKVTRTSV
ncbi:NAD(P)-binding domain-containing protein [Nocardioides ginsengisoli]|uniref:NAD(P)-dependent oxidoreductase n=1 Tax=Nocardioides ginsengisoli TaxID=363868 RepID=A0ABW3VX47_9ACTN